MERPADRVEPADREDVMCELSFTSLQEHPPFHHRRGLATVGRRQVDTYGAARLFCDCLHEGPHRWPHAYEPLVPESDDETLPDDSVDEREVRSE